MKHLITSGIFSALLFTATPSFAQSTAATGNFNANATVASNCLIDIGPGWDAGALNTLKNSYLKQTREKITVKCTQGTPIVTLKRDMGLHTTCKQNGLFGEEQLLKSNKGDLFPYSISLFNGPQWSCDPSDYDANPKLDFSATNTQDVFFELNFGSSHSIEGWRLWNIAREGTYTDTMTFTVEF